MTMDEDENRERWTPEDIDKEIEYLETLQGTWTQVDRRNDNTHKEDTRPETEFVLVETIVTYRMRYVVEVEKGNTGDTGNTTQDHIAEGLVIRGEAKEFSQLALGETVVSTRIIEKKDIIALCDEDNDYASTWSDDQKMGNFVETINYFEGKKQ